MIKVIAICVFILFFIKIYEGYYRNKKKIIYKKKFTPPNKSKVQDADFEDVQ